MIKKFLYEPIFFADVIFIAGCSLDQLNKYLDKKGYPSDGAQKFNAYTCTFEKKLKGGNLQVKYLIWISDKKDFYALVHETNHLTQKILTDRGVPYTSENTEVIAYYQDFWVKRLWRLMNK